MCIINLYTPVITLIPLSPFSRINLAPYIPRTIFHATLLLLIITTLLLYTLINSLISNFSSYANSHHLGGVL